MVVGPRITARNDASRICDPEELGVGADARSARNTNGNVCSNIRLRTDDVHVTGTHWLSAGISVCAACFYFAPYIGSSTDICFVNTPTSS